MSIDDQITNASIVMRTVSVFPGRVHKLLIAKVD